MRPAAGGRGVGAAVVVLLACAGCGLLTPQTERHLSAHSTQGADLPAALDALYPPGSPAPVYLMGMVRLDALLSGIMVDLSEGDKEGGLGTLNLFKQQYQSVADMVPEWKACYPNGPLEALEVAMLAGNREAISAACEEIGKSCHVCHTQTMVPVQQKYRWGSFQAVRAKDPFSNEAIDYRSFKRRLSTNLSGIGHNLSQGQVENAKEQFRQFNALAQILKDTCFDCHATESRHFTDDEFQERIDRLGTLLAQAEVKTSAVTDLMQDIGQESCSKCHLVHVPAAQAGQQASR